MTKAGPQRFPGASTAHWYQDDYPGDAMETNVVVWHSTEGTSLPTYSGGSIAPNFTMLPDFTAKRLKVYQHFDFDVSARALVNASGGVETNTLNVAQVEIVGTCDPATHKKWGSTQHLYMPDLPDWAIRDLAAFAKWAHDEHGVPLTSSVTWTSYPASYGKSPVRMSASKWEAYRGHCGHQHVPENVHGDPGSFPMAQILGLADDPQPPATPVVDLSRLIEAARTDPKAKQGHQTYAAGVKVVESALRAEGLLSSTYASDGSFGSVTVAAYSAWQRSKAGGGYTGAAADGIPGEASLERLGARHHFHVIA